MPGLLILADDLAPDGPAAVLPRVVPAVVGRSRVGIAVLGRVMGPVADELIAAGLPPVSLPVRGLLDLAGLRQVRNWAAAFDPDLIHAIGPTACRIAALLRLPVVGLKRHSSLVVSGVTDCDGLFSRRAARAAVRVLVDCESDAARIWSAGVPAGHVTVIPPGITPPSAGLDPLDFRKSLGIPPAGRLIVAAGRFDPAADLKSAVWAFDVVKYVTPDVFLVLVGDGPERGRVERFARALGFDDYRVRFAGGRYEAASVFALAEVVWVTHRRGGVTTALQSLAAGRPVVAVRTPELAEELTDRVSGRLVPQGDRVQLAAVTHELLERPAAAAALGAAGRAAVLDRFPAGRLADAYTAVYHDLAGIGR
ncbi:MAG: glycosyltransferase [Gemmataceae bacterium]